MDDDFDLSGWPLDMLPDTDARAIESRRRAFEAALAEFIRIEFEGDLAERAVILEVFEVALDEAWERAGLRPLRARPDDEPLVH